MLAIICNSSYATSVDLARQISSELRLQLASFDPQASLDDYMALVRSSEPVFLGVVSPSLVSLPISAEPIEPEQSNTSCKGVQRCLDSEWLGLGPCALIDQGPQIALMLIHSGLDVSSSPRFSTTTPKLYGCWCSFESRTLAPPEAPLRSLERYGQIQQTTPTATRRHCKGTHKTISGSTRYRCSPWCRRATS